MKYLFILNNPPYGTEHSYNALRLATALTKTENASVFVFLLGDAATCAQSGQTTPTGYYNLERMLMILHSKGAQIGVCGTCMDGRGIKPENLGRRTSQHDGRTGRLGSERRPCPRLLKRRE